MNPLHPHHPETETPSAEVLESWLADTSISSIAELLNSPQSQQQPEWVINDFLARRNVMLILGPPKTSCKSWLLYNLAWDIGEGKHIWNATQSPHGRPEPRWTPPRPMRVVYFCQEDTEDDIKGRIRLLANEGQRVLHDNLYCIPKDLSFNFDTEAGWNKSEHTSTKGDRTSSFSTRYDDSTLAMKTIRELLSECG